MAHPERPHRPRILAGARERVHVWATLLALALASGTCIAAWHREDALVGEWGFPLDDSWIHCQIARNLVHGSGWSYNPGVPVQNSSGPLWTALVALGFALAGPTVWVPKLLGVLCFLACVVLTGRLAWTWSTDRLAAALAMLLAASSVPLAWHGLSGMETPLAAFLVAATFAAFYGWQAGWRRWVWPVLAALAAATRPETLLLVPLLVTERGWALRTAPGGNGRQALRESLRAGGIALAFLVPYFVLNLTLSGSLFPTTFAAKAGDTGLGSALHHLDARELLLCFTLYPYIWTVHALSFWGHMNVGLLLAVPLGVCVVARGPRRALAPGLLLLALPALRGLAAPYNLPSLHQGRYIGCLLPLFYIFAAVGLSTLLRTGADAALRRTRTVAVVTLVLVGIAWVRLASRVPHVGSGVVQAIPILLRGGSFGPGLDAPLQIERLGLFLALLTAAGALLLGALPPGARRGLGLALGALALGIQITRLPLLPRLYAHNVRDIQAMDVTLGRWVKQNVPPGTRIGVNDIGAIAYFGEHPIIDAMGLATPELTPYGSPKRLRTLVALRRLQPQLCIIFPNWFPEWTTRASLLHPVFRQRVEYNTILGGSESIVFQMDWSRFARYYSDSLLTKLDPPIVDASFASHVRRGIHNLGLPTRAELAAHAGDLLFQRGDPTGAQRLYQRATALDPHELASWRGRLRLYDSQHREAELGRMLQMMARLLPNSADAEEALGQWLERSARLAEAAAAYERALELHPDHLRLLAEIERNAAKLGDDARVAACRARRLELESPPQALLPTPPQRE